MSSESGSRKPKNKYVPTHGREFEIAVRVTDEYKTSRTRDTIAYFLLGSAAAAMLTAVGYGFTSGNFSALKDVWTVAGPFVGGIIGYYFQQGRRESG